jgi:CheY-like chemotaxis protein
MLDAQHVDLLLLDIMLPGIDGWEVCRRIRATAALVTLPILLFTVRSADTDEDQPERTLVNGVIAKPFLRDHLIGAVQQMLA